MIKADAMSKNTPSRSPQDSSFHKGLEGVVASQTALSLVDGENSKLYYRGISINELIDSSFEEVVYLLWFGKLPSRHELADFKKKLADERTAPSEILSIILKTFPKKAHPMAALRSLVSFLGTLDLEAEKNNPAASLKRAYRLTAVFPALIAAFYRTRKGLDPIVPRKDLSHAAGFLYMMEGREPSAGMERALDAYLILLADHGLNASTFSARVTISTNSDIYSAITSAVGTLKGDLHGAANQKAMEMILEIGTPEKAEAYVKNLLAQKKKVMGFGHRIYKKEDPRATAFREIAKKLCERHGDTRWMEISTRVEKVMWEEKKIPCNVDFFSASVLYILGIPVDFFTTIFAMSRVAGWTAHVIEQLADNRLIRPSAEYVGPKNRHYLPMDKRK